MIALPPRCHTVVASLHPAFAMHGLPQFKPFIAQAIHRAQKWANSDGPPMRPRDLGLEPTADQLADYIDTPERRLVLDVETPRDAPTQILICGVSTRQGSATVFPWTGEYVEVIRDALADPKLIVIGHNFAYDYRALRAYGISVNGFIFDTIQAGSLLWPPFREAKKRRWNALSTYATRLSDVAPFWKNPDDPTTQAFFRAAWPNVSEALHPRLYCALDCVFTGVIQPAIVEHLRHEGMYDTYVDYVAPASRVLMDLEERGFGVDEAARVRLREETRSRLSDLESRVREFADTKHKARLVLVREAVASLERRLEEAIPAEPRCGAHPDYGGMTKREKCAGCKHVYWVMEPARAGLRDLKARIRKGQSVVKRIGPHFQADNDDHWRWLLFNKDGLALKPAEITPKRREPKVDDRALTLLQYQHPDLDVLRWRVQTQRLLHRLRNVLAMELSEDGRAHFVYSQHRTENMRIASGLDAEEDDKLRDSPGNAQNVKHEDRKLFIPSRDGWVLAKFDWKQVELYRVAWLAEDWDLLQAIWDGEDIHSLNAAAIFGIAPEKAREHMVWFEGAQKDARYAAKRATHGWDYYMQAKLTAKLYGMSLRAAAAARAGYFQRWRRLEPWQQAQIARASKQGHLRNSFGYRLPFYQWVRNHKTGAWEVADKAVAVAFEPASDVAFMCKEVLTPLNAIKVSGANLLHTEHDSFTFEVPELRVAELAKAVLPILKRTWPIFGERRGKMFAAGVDVEVGRNWGKHHKHGTKCSTAACSLEENPEGFQEWRG